MLDWVYGRNNSASNAMYTHNGDILYPAGAMAIKPSTRHGINEQTFFMGDHTGHVSALTVWHDTSTTVVASSQIAHKPNISVWSATSMELIVSLVGFHRTGVSHLDFSPSGNLLLSVGMDHHHSEDPQPRRNLGSKSTIGPYT